MMSRISTKLHPQYTHTKISKNVYSFFFKGDGVVTNVCILEYMSLSYLLLPVYALLCLYIYIYVKYRYLFLKKISCKKKKLTHTLDLVTLLAGMVSIKYILQKKKI